MSTQQRHGMSLAPGRPEKIQGHHRDRLAVVYVRQSTLQQVERHQESTRLQYALKDRAIQLGWSPQRVEVIDDDLGQSGASAEGRRGFQRLVTDVGLNQVGLVLGIEMSRLARSCRDWYHLIDMCALFRTLIGDSEGIYDPTQYNDRLLLGLKGTMSEAELYLIKHRMDAGRWAKAQRGELVVPVPIGYVRRPCGEVIKDPDAQARSVVELIFATFERCRSINGVLRYLLEHEIRLPVRERCGPERGNLRWAHPTRGTLQGLLRNPAYAGTYAYGRHPVDPTKQQAGRPGTGRTEIPLEEWAVCLHDQLPAYITWEEYLRNRRQMQANVPKQCGAPRQGTSLLAGLIVCGRCGRRMLTRYSSNGSSLRYLCEGRKKQYQEPLCQSVPGPPIEAAISELVVQAVAPLALESSLAVLADLEAERGRLRQQWDQRLERAHEEVRRAFRQYNAVDPEHRLVARELERQWEAGLAAEAAVQVAYDREVARQPLPFSAGEQAAIRDLAAHLPALWQAPSTTAADRQVLARAMLDCVVVTPEGQTERIGLELEWVGGHRTTLTVIRPVPCVERLSYYPDLLQRALQLHTEGLTFQAIAERLSVEGWRPASGQGAWTMSMVWNLLDRPDGRPRTVRHLSKGLSKAAHEWEVYEFADRMGMSRFSVYTWLKRGRLRARRVPHRGRLLWLIWADDAEFERLQTQRTQPPRRRPCVPVEDLPDSASSGLDEP